MQHWLLPVAGGVHGLRTPIRHLILTVAKLLRGDRRWHLNFAKMKFRLDWQL